MVGGKGGTSAETAAERGREKSVRRCVVSKYPALIPNRASGLASWADKARRKAVGGKVDTTRGDPVSPPTPPHLLTSQSAAVKLTIHPNPQTPEEDQAELHRYDRKVHAACTTMIRATVSELKALGVPFFGMNPGMILRGDETANGDVERKPNGNKIEERELERLQRRMLELLEDLCKE